jgi:hypothetical protein
MAGPFKMSGFSGFVNSPMKKNDSWVEQIFSASRRGEEAQKRNEKQKSSGQVKKVQDAMSKGNKGAVPTMGE